MKLLKSNYLFIYACIFLLFAIYSIFDYIGPPKIYLKPFELLGVPAFRSKDLLIQGTDIENKIWATRGMVVYKYSDSDKAFFRKYHIPTGLSIHWLRNFNLVRKITLRPECVELLPLSDTESVAMSAARVWYKSISNSKFEDTLFLPNYGIGRGQGIRNSGITYAGNSTLFMGEYYLNVNRTPVRIFSSYNKGQSWDTAFIFKPGEIRHIHSIQKDPFSNRSWICTGDLDEESMIAWSDDNFISLNPLGKGGGMWRSCQLVFTPDYIYWGTDTTDNDISGIYRWNRKTNKTVKLYSIKGLIFYSTILHDGTIVMSTNRAGRSNEEDNKTRLFIITNGDRLASIPFGTWDSKRKFAKLRLQRDQGGRNLFITCLNHKEFSDGDIVVLSESSVKKIAYNAKSIVYP